jgi:integrase
MASTPGIYVRHSRSCKSRDGGKCNCEPSFEPWVYSKRDGKKIRGRERDGQPFKTLAAAKGWRIDALKGVKDRRLRAPSAVTLRQEVDEWLEGAREGRILNKRERPYKPAVIRNYELALRLRVLPVLGDRRLASIDLADLLELKEQLQGDGRSASVVRNTFVPLQAIYRRARLQGRIPVDPTTDLPLPTAGQRDRAASPQQAAELLAPLDKLAGGAWATAFYASLRRGELRALRVRCVNLEEGWIDVEHGWDDKEGEIDTKSDAGARRVFIADALRPYLEPLVEGRAPDELVFGHDQTPFESRALARKAERAWDAADEARAELGLAPLERFTLQEARASFRTWIDATPIGDTRGDRYHGHADEHVRGRYIHPLPAQLEADRAVFDEYVAGAAAGKVVALTAAG